MTDEQKLNFLLKELKLAALQQCCYDGKGGGDYYEYPELDIDIFEDGEVYGFVSFARGLLESIGESYD
jgi:hypothetical protein